MCIVCYYLCIFRSRDLNTTGITVHHRRFHSGGVSAQNMGQMKVSTFTLELTSGVIYRVCILAASGTKTCGKTMTVAPYRLQVEHRSLRFMWMFINQKTRTKYLCRLNDNSPRLLNNLPVVFAREGNCPKWNNICLICVRVRECVGGFWLKYNIQLIEKNKCEIGSPVVVDENLFWSLHVSFEFTVCLSSPTLGEPWGQYGNLWKE